MLLLLGGTVAHLVCKRTCDHLPVLLQVEVLSEFGTKLIQDQVSIHGANHRTNCHLSASHSAKQSQWRLLELSLLQLWKQTQSIYEVE